MKNLIKKPLYFRFAKFAVISVLAFSENFLYSDAFQSSILATVNGEPITLFDVMIETAGDELRVATIYSGAELAMEIEKIRKKKAMALVERKILFEEFKEKEYKIPEQYIEDMLDGLASDVAGGDRKKLEKKALQSGMTLNDLRLKAHEKVAVDILINEFCYKNIFVAPKEIEDYYRNNAGEFMKPSQIELQVLLLKKDGRYAEAFDETLKKIQSDAEKADKSVFATLVKLYSEGPNVPKAGDIGWIEESKLRPEFAEALKNLDAGKIVGPVETGEGSYFIRISEKIPANAQPFGAVQDKIREKLIRFEREKRYADYLEKIRKKAVIRYFFERERQ